MKRTLSAALLLFLPLAAQAADDAGSFRVKGVGLETCRSYLQHQAAKSPAYYVARSWLNGYLTAYNQWVPSSYDIAGNTQLDQLSGWIDEYCKLNPEQRYVTAAARLVEVMEPNRLISKPQVRDTAGGEDSSADLETLQHVQRTLKERGYYQGAVDGIMGARTRAAIAAFQRDANMEPTGRLDAATLTQLLQ